MTTRSRLQSQIKKVRARVDAETKRRKKQITALRARAADAALHWVISHQPRVDAFRNSVRGTPVAKAVDRLLDLLKSNASSRAKPRKTARRAAKKRPAAKKRAGARKARK